MCLIISGRTLASDGARAFAMAHEAGTVKIIPPESLITSRSKDEWKRWKDQLSNADRTEIDPHGLRDRLDTVGAVACLDADGVAAGVSRSVFIPHIFNQRSS